ncbi:hypothetical protein P3H15_52700 [Rhodococcus sp. T2V]|nr:ATP-binding cassette domain-containing protein [Rhodococcus sp. T2V]MDF3313557.1 hypothetical protein [Rhodococcus sp. T2V]
MSKSDIAAKVDDAAKILDLTQHLDRKPADLSGGQRQRIEMGRAIVRNPKAFVGSSIAWSQVSSPSARISRSTVHRATWIPCRLSSA